MTVVRDLYIAARAVRTADGREQLASDLPTHVVFQAIGFGMGPGSSRVLAAGSREACVAAKRLLEMP
jgi:hypothetical protein